MSEERTPYYTGPQRPQPRKKARPKSVRYGPGRYTPAPNGRGYDCSVCLGGTRHRARMPDEAAARAWIDATEASAAAALPALTRAQLIDARHALSLLPEGVTLADAARAWTKASGAIPSDPLSDCAAAFLAERRATGLRPATLDLYRQAARRLIRSAGDLPAAELTRAHIEALLAGLTPQARNGLLRHLGAFLSWCAATGRIPANPAASIPKAIVSEPPRGIITPRQTAGLLACAAAARPDLVPYLALGFFAGIRPDELGRLRGGRIGAEYILLDGSVTKTRDTRSVEIRPNLRAWLDAHPPPPEKPVAPLSRRRLYDALRRVRAATLGLAEKANDPALAVNDWPADCARHCYATYAYELTRDAALVASELGHKGVQVFFAHYRALAHPGDGEKYFAITPESTAELTTLCQRSS